MKAWNKNPCWYDFSPSWSFSSHLPLMLDVEQHHSTTVDHVRYQSKKKKGDMFGSLIAKGKLVGLFRGPWMFH